MKCFLYSALGTYVGIIAWCLSMAAKEKYRYHFPKRALSPDSSKRGDGE